MYYHTCIHVHSLKNEKVVHMDSLYVPRTIIKMVNIIYEHAWFSNNHCIIVGNISDSEGEGSFDELLTSITGKE